MDVTLKVPALEKLLDYAASGIGAIAGPMLANWRASREGKARLTSTLADVEVRRIETESKARSLQIIADAQAKARQSIDTTIEPGHGIMVEITRDDIVQSIEFQGQKRIANTRSILEDAAEELGDKKVSDHEPDHDWTARFFNDIQDVSSEEMQLLWAKVLAGEVERPGSTSIRTLSILRNLDQETGGLFINLCSARIDLKFDGDQAIDDSRVLSLGGNAATNALQKYGLVFDSLNVLNEHGLIISDYNSWRDYRVSTGIFLSKSTPVQVFVPFSFQGRYWILSPTSELAAKQEFKFHGVALTRSGRELARIVEAVPMDEYAQALRKFFETKNLQMTEVDGPAPHLVEITPPHSTM